MEDLTPNQSGIRVGIVYNTFKPHEVDWHTLPYVEGATVKDYIGDLSEGTWQVGYMGEAYGPDQWGDLTLNDGDAFSFVQVPESGGSGGKDILRMVAMIAVMVVAFYVVGPWAAKFGSDALVGLGTMTTANLASGIAMGSFAMAGMLAVNALIPPAGMSTKEEGRNYGIDGPKNTAKEGPVVPRGYGKYWFAGNVVDSYTKLIGDTQYLFVRTVVNDGPIKSVSDFRINGEPIANYDNVETRVSLGTNDGEANDWFGEAVRMQSIGAELDTDWTTRTTNTEVDRVRIDLTYPEGLGYWKDDGKVVPRLSQIQFRYRKVGDTAWKALHSAYEFPFVGVYGTPSASSGYGIKPKQVDTGFLDSFFGPGFGAAYALRYGDTFSDGSSSVFNRGIETYGDLTPQKAISPLTGRLEDVAIANVPAGASRVTAQVRAGIEAYENATNGAYKMALFYRERGSSTWLQSGQTHTGTVERNRSGEEWANFPLVYRSASVVLDPSKQYEVAVFGGIITAASATITGGTSGQIEFHKAAQESFRYSFESAAVERGRYEVSVRRVTGADDNPKSRDSVYWTDLAEIDLENIHYVGTANVSLKIKVDDQINSIPNFTCLVEASKVNIFDIDGNVVENRWSPYPCWHAIDVLTNQETGRGLPTPRIDFASVLEWEAHCIEHGLEFNAVFDQKTNVWDVLQKLCRVGHAQIVRQGTKYTFIVDKKAEPVQVFNDSNILDGSFSTTWLGINERANEIRYTYYPTEKEGKEEMLRVADPFAVKNGIEPRVLEISEQGVTNREQAMFNIEKQLCENRYIRKSVSFDAPLESISLTIGEVALVQHSSAHYGKGIGTGLLKQGSTASRLMLDCPITLEEGKDYRVLTVHDALKRYTVNIESINHNTLYVSGLPEGALNRCVRLKQGSVDVAVDNIHDGNPFDRVTCSSTKGLTVGTAELWDTEVIEERSVKFEAGEIEEIELVTPLSAAPSAYAKWMVGPVETIKVPMRLRAVSGDDLYRRSLTFIEYNDLVYEPLDADYQPSQPPLSTVTAHVKSPSISWPLIVEGQMTRVTMKVSWERGDVNYAGADLYVSRNGAPFEFMRSAQDVTAVEMDANLNDDILVRIVAFGRNGLRQSVATAPVVGTVVRPGAGQLPPPYNLTVALTSFKVDASLIAEWDEPASGMSYRVQYLGLPDMSQGAFDALRPENQTFDKEWGARDEWKTVGTTDETEMEIPRLSEGKILVRVRTENGRSQSGYVYAKFDVAAPNLPAAVRNLRLNGSLTATTFSGKDAFFTWDDILDPEREVPPEEEEWSEYQWADYEVIILDADGEVIRKEYTRAASYTYSFEKNVGDSFGNAFKARRAFQIEVRIRDKAGRRSYPASKSANNPRPPLPSVTFRTGRNLIQANFSEPRDSDYEGTVFWFSESETFAPSEGNMGWSGRGGIAEWTTPKATKYFVRYGAFDAFDNTDMAVSPAIAVKPGSIFDGLNDDTEAGKNLGDFVGDRIDEILESRGDIDPAMLTDYIFNRAANETTQQAFTEFVGMVNDEPVGVFAKRRTEDLSSGLDYVTQDVSLIGARSEDAKSFILDIDTVKVGPDESFANRLSNMTAETERALGAITREEQARVDADRAETLARETMGVRFNETIGLYRDEVFLLAEDLSFEAGRINSLIGEVGDQRTLIIEETEQRIKDGEVFTKAINLLGSVSPSGDAFILNEATAIVGPKGSLASVLEGIEAEFQEIDTELGKVGSKISGAISAEREVRVGAEDALARSIGTVSLKTDSLDGRITTVHELYDDLEGNFRARAALSVKFNDRITGWEIDGVTRSFNVAANHFGVTTETPDGAILNPFTILGNKINMTADVVIDGNLLVSESITTNRIKANNITIIDAASMAGTRVGNGSTQTAITYVINLAEPAKLLAWASGRQAYLAGNQPYAFDIAINGNVYPGVSGSGGPIDSVNAQAFANVPAGSHTVTCRWFGTNNQLSLANATMMIMAVFK